MTHAALHDSALGTRRWAHWHLASSSVLLAFTALAFAGTTLGGFVYDDGYLIVDNPDVHQLSNLSRTLLQPFWNEQGAAHGLSASGYYRPWITLVLTLEYRFFGPQPFGFHVVSVLLHLAIVALVYGWLARRFDGALHAAHGGVIAVTFGAASFTLHPMRAETVSWISGCADLWMSLFVLLALWGWDTLQGLRRVAVTSGLLTLALLCKEAAVLLPAWLWLDTYLREPASERRRRRLRDAALVCVLAVLTLACRLWLVPVSVQAPSAWGAQHFERVFATLGAFARMALWPWPSSLLGWAVPHAAGTERLHYPSDAVALGTVVALGLLLSAAWAWRRAAARAAVSEVALVGCLLLPTLNVISLEQGQLAAERYWYLPWLGMAALLTRALLRLARRFDQQGPVAMLLSAGPLLMAAAAGTVVRSGDFHDEASLWQHEHAVHPSHTLPLRQLAYQRLQARDFEEANSLAQRAYALSGEDRAARISSAMLAARAELERSADADQPALSALTEFYDALASSRAAELHIGNLVLSVTLREHELGVLGDVRAFVIPRAMAYARTGRLAAARAALQACIAARPHELDCLHALVMVDARAGDFDACARLVDQGLALAPRHAQLSSLRERVTRARESLARTDLDVDMHVVARAHAFLLLAAVAPAAAVLDDALRSRPDAPVLIATRAQVDALEHRLDTARARIAEGRARFPQAEALWSDAEREIERAHR